MGKSAPSPPPAPDPVALANAQSQSNIETAREQQRLNMVNAYGPGGSVLYSADPTAPGGYQQTTQLSPGQQAIYDALNKAQLGAVNIGVDQLGRVQQALNTPLDTTNLPTLYSQFGVGDIKTRFNQGQPLQYSYDQGQPIQGQVGGSIPLAQLMAENAAYGQATSRLDPMWQEQQNQLNAHLAAMGVADTSDAARTAQADFARNRNDAYQQAIYGAIQQGLAAQGQTFGEQVQQGQFANQAAAQEYAQAQQAAQFHNQAAGQDYTQNLGAAQFANAGQNQYFQQALAEAQLSNQARQQALQEQAYVQNQPINQLTGLLGLGQVQMPQGIQYQGANVQPTDVLGAYALNQQQQNANYQARLAQQQGLMGGLFGLGSAAILASDRRLKSDIRRLGTRPDGLGVYLYRKGGRPEFGVIAQEVRELRPEAVIEAPSGLLYVDYDQLAKAA